MYAIITVELTNKHDAIKEKGKERRERKREWFALWRPERGESSEGTVLLKSSSVRVTSSLRVPGHCHSVLADKMIMTTSCEIFHTSQNLSGVPQFQIVAIIHVHPLLLKCNYIVNKVPVLINISHVHTHLSPRPYMAR